MNNNLYNYTLDLVSKGAKFKVNFEDKSLQVDKNFLIRGGTNLTDMDLVQFDGDALDEIEKLFKNYKYSIPSIRTNCQRKKYFNALTLEELSDSQMVLGENRELAQAKLEIFVLMSFINNHQFWEDLFSDRWFYKGKDPDLIILKDWL